MPCLHLFKTESAAPPVDAVVGGTALILGGAAIIDDQTTPSEFKGVGTIVVGIPLLAIGTLYGLSATYGFVQTSRCRRFHRELGTSAGAGAVAK